MNPLPGNLPHGPQPPPLRPEKIADVISAYVKALVVIIFWTVIGAGGLCAGYVALKAIWMFAELALRAIGG